MQKSTEQTLIVNGEARVWSPGLTVGALIAGMGLNPARLAVELNGDILPGGGMEEQPLAPGDVLEIVQFVGGG